MSRPRPISRSALNTVACASAPAITRTRRRAGEARAPRRPSPARPRTALRAAASAVTLAICAPVHRPGGGARGQAEQLAAPLGRGPLGRGRGRRHARAASVFWSQADVSQSARERGGQRAAGDEAEVARAGARHEPRLGARGERLDHGGRRLRPPRAAGRRATGAPAGPTRRSASPASQSRASSPARSSASSVIADPVAEVELVARGAGPIRAGARPCAGRSSPSTIRSASAVPASCGASVRNSSSTSPSASSARLSVGPPSHSSARTPRARRSASAAAGVSLGQPDELQRRGDVAAARARPRG